jgi:amino acid adenylation domain-containing protein
MDNDLILTSEMFEEAEKYWRDNLSGELIELDFPGDYSRTGQYDRGNFKLSFGEQAAHQLIRISKNNDFLLDVILLTVFKILIHKFTGQNDIIVSSSVLKTSNQNYNKCIALRDFLSPGMTFKELLLKVKESAADGYKYQYYPIRKLIKLLKIENPTALFKFTFLLANIHEKEFLGDITANGENDIIFSINKNDEGLEGEITYNSNLFKEETIQRLYNGYKRILTQVLSDTNIRLSEINTLTEEEKKEILVDFNNTGAEYPKEKTLHRLFDELVKQKSNHIVSVEIDSSRPDGLRCISYRELSERANRVAVQLCRRGAVGGSVISLMIGHSIDLLVGMLGILKAGCVYLPLDPDYPGDRINLMLSDSGSRMVLISADLADKCEGIRFEGEIIEISGGEIAGVEESGPSARLTAPDDPAYIIYTSGSTGTPKGVVVEHRNVVRLVKNMNYIDFSREDRMLPTGAIAFDISTFEIWGPLLNGVKLYFVDEPVILDPERLAKVIIENEITILHLIPQLFNQTAAQKIEIFAGLKYLLVGGDVVKPGYINEVRNRHKNLKILQMYGPTENTTFTTYFPVDKNYEVNIPIGKPVANSTVYILDRFYNLQPPGIVGELCTGGDGIARGYLNSPGLTAEKFVSNPFVPGDRLYKTGDLARWLPDGNIEFLGRSDNQVKIRGYRIELGEIERVLSARAKIEEAIIVIKQDEEENPYLCAYFTSGEDIEISELRKYLAGRLPDYMIPLFFVPLDKLPLTPNGKIDRKVLPEPKVKRSDEYAAPRDEVERKLVKIWSEVLRLEKDVIGIDANFFQLGGHSLKATLMAFAVHKELKVKLSMNQVFKTPTIRELAVNIQGAEEYKYSVIGPVEEKEYYSLSSAQKRLYIIQQIELETTSYMPYVMPLREEPDTEELENTLRKLIARHESLRTSFKVIVDEPVQIIHEDVEFKIRYYDSESVSGDEKTGVDDKVEENREIQHLKFIIQNLFIRPFDLSKAPLLRVGLIKTIEKEFILMFDIHHIITDAISNDILIKDFKALYEGKELPPLRIQYKDFSRWQNSEKEEESIRKQETYWIGEFEGEIPVINLPTDYSRPAVQSIEGDSVNFEISRDHTAALKAAALKEGVTLYMVVLAVLNVFLAKIANQEDIVVGTAVAGRRHADLEKIIGMFVNTLALRNQPVQEKPFREFLSEVKKKTLEAFENQDHQFEDLVDKVLVNRDAARNPLFDVIYGFQSFDENSISGDLARLEDDKKSIMKISQYDLIFNCVEQKEKLFFTLHYCTKLFKKETVERFIGCFKQIVIWVIKEPGLESGKIEIISKEEKRRILYDFNDTGTTYPQDKTIHRLFEKQAAQTPGKIAIVGNWQGVAPPADKRAVGKEERTGETVQLTYGELNKKSNQLAQVLKEKGVQPDTIVGIMIERSLEMIVGILAILKTGASYLPIDADFPGKRVKYMLDDGNVSVLLTKSSIIENHSFIDLQGLQSPKAKLHRTEARKAITDLEKTLPIPDRSLVSYEKYSKEIGIAMARHTIAIMATRGCPYKCLYCHKIWPKKHVFRSAEHILAEVQIYYNMGIRRFVIIDDIFNLNIKNSTKFFKLLIENKMDVQIFFPNGVRGDILTKDYIDIMVEAGTIHLALALETGSPRLQKLIEKNIDVEKLHENMAYICKMYPQVISELFTMHGFPTETEDEAKMTIDFIKSLKWLHLPLLNILKIYPNTDMADFAIKNGISEEAIARSENLGYHELPETLPFDRKFTMECQMDFLEYILSKERLLHVLPYQMKVLTWTEMLQKYNSFLPTEINELDDLLKLAGITREEVGPLNFLEEDHMKVPDFDRKIKQHFTAPAAPIAPKEEKNALKIILIDVSRFFSGECDMLYDVGEPPLGLMSLLTYLKKIYGRKINGKIVKSRTDFDSYAGLKKILEEFKPAVIGMRTLNFFNQFFHKTAAMIRHWGFDVPIIAGGPYATSDYKRILHDRNVDLVVLGEGEITFAELVGKIMKNDRKLPDEEVLKEIAGIAFMPGGEVKQNSSARDIIMLDLLSERLSTMPGENLIHNGHASDLAYAMYTSGSTGKPKGVLVKHRNVVRLVKNTNFVEFSPDNRVLPTGALDFDASTFEIWGALLNGSRLHLADKETILTPETLKAIIRMYDITLMWLTSPLFNYLVEADIDIFSGLITLVVGGDALSPAHINKVRKRYPLLKIINGYGPTENTTFSTVFSIEREYEESIPIGRPVANSTAYILDRWHRLVPVGVVGELCVGGDGLSRGYLNNPELTAEKFIHLTLNTQHSTLYKTGDLCRWLADGNIKFAGRIDHQVKIRGYRIEPGEIKSHLLRHKDMKEVVVTVGEFSVGDGFGELKEEKYICAYFVAGKELSSSEIRQYLSSHLPDYMIPSYFMQLEKILLNPNGKVDREALPSPVIQASSKYAAPRDEIEKKLVEIWGDVLNRDMLPESPEPPVSFTQSGGGTPIGIDDDFFELGGHSLKATILMSRIHKELNVKLELGKIFVTPTIRGLAKDIKSTSTDKYTSIGPVEQKEYYALSSAQKRLYVLQQIGKDNTGYNLPFIFMLEGTLDSRRLQKTFEGMIARHEAFRTGFEMVNEEPVQRIHKENLKLQIENYNGGGTPNPIKMPTSNFQITNIIRNFIRPFDLSHVPLLRVGLIKTGETKHLLIVDMHHIIADGMSMGVFVRDFMSLYEGKELPRLRIRCRDYALWQNSEKEKEEAKTREAYWVKEFSGDIPGLNLPLDYPRPDVQTFAGNRGDFVIDKEETALLKEIVKKENVTLFIVLLGVFNVFLSKLSGQEEIIVGAPTAGRKHADLEKLIGMFVNTLPLRNHPRGEMRFGDFIKKLSPRTLEAFENQEYPFEELVERLDVPRDVSRNPLFDVVFLLQNIDIPPLRITGLTLTHYDYDPGISKFDLMVVGDEVGEQLAFTLEYCTRLFKKETIERYISYFKRVVTEVTRGPSRIISSIEIISAEEKKQVLFDFNNTERKYPGNKTIHHVFEEQTARAPDGVAVLGRIAGDYLYVTYNRLNEKTNRVARLLREEGVQPGTIVGMMTDRSFEMIIGILGILKAGGAYLPILPNTPPERINYILRDSNARLVLTQKEHIHLHKHGIRDGTALIDPGDEPRHPAYVIYTSGSTGKPKGVMVDHSSVVNLLYALDDRYPFTPTDTYLLKTSYIFDVSVTELYGWFWGGGRMAVLEKGAEKDPDAILDMIENALVTHINFVPSMFNTFVSILSPGNIGRLSGLKYLFLAGEPITPGSLRKFRGLNSRCQLENIYGPTEAAVYGSWYSLADWKGSGPIPIGQPLHNVRLYIVDKYDNLQPVGVLGELCIAGAGIARGYLNRPELTAEKFDHDLWDFRDYHDDKKKENYQTFFGGSRAPRRGGPKKAMCLEPNAIRHAPCSMLSPPGRRRLYRTGDLARWLSDGNIEFFGRIDHQVKIRGFRVEPGEIESQLLTYDGIKQAVVTTNEDNDGNRCLCAYIAADNRWEASELRERLSKKLPDYMIPAFFVQLDKIPLTAGGKLDRQALPEPRPGEKGEKYKAPADEVEEKLAVIWSQVLDIEKEKISMDTSFFHLGGHSLKAAVLVSKLHKELNVKVPMEEIFKNPGIRQLARYVKNLEKEKYIPVRQVEKKEYYPLSLTQKRFSVLNRMDPRSTGYNMSLVMVMAGETDRNKLENAFGKLIKGHESLRTSFKMVEGEPVQEIHGDVPFAIEYYDVGSSNRDSTGRIEETVKNFIRPFDFSRAPLLRVGLIRAGQPDQKHILVVDMHHIITDGSSQMILNRDFMAAYAGEELPPLNFQYKDFSQWQNSAREKEKRKKQEEYWLKVFEKEAPLLNLPTDYQRPEVRTFEGDTVEFTFTGEEADKVKVFASSYDITLYILLLAVYYVLLWRLSGDEDIIVGCASSGRSRSEFQQVVGLFVNLLALRNHPSKERTFEEFLLEVKERTLEAFANQDFPFESLVEKVAGKRDVSRQPLMDAGFSMQNLEQLSAPGAEESRIWSISHDFIKISIKLDINLEVHEKGEQLLFVFQYALELFKEETIRAIIHYFRKIISAVMENPQAKLEEIEIMSADEKYEVHSEIKEIRENIYADFDF